MSRPSYDKDAPADCGGVGGVKKGNPMKAILSPEWELSTDDPASSDGQPVLVNRSSWKVFGPGDKVKLYPSQGPVKAAHAVARLAETAKLNADGEAMVARFVGSVRPR